MRGRKPFDAAGWLTSNPLRALVATEGTGLEPVRACAQRFSRPPPYQLGLALPNSKANLAPPAQTSMGDDDRQVRGRPYLRVKSRRERHPDNGTAPVRRPRSAQASRMIPEGAGVRGLLERAFGPLLEQSVFLPAHSHLPRRDRAVCREVRIAGGVRVELRCLGG